MIGRIDELTIASAQGAYPVAFHPTIESLVAALLQEPHCLVIVDGNVASHHRDAIKPLLENRITHVIDSSEEEKSLEGCSRVLAFLQANNASRQTQLIAIGGGVIQDIATFCSHIYFRGLKWIYVPTTLLGMSDSCIGAKASINFNGFKNQLGVFHSPASVHICPRFLDSLPEIEIRSGYGEIVKLHLAGSRLQFAELARTLRAKGWGNPLLEQFVHASLSIKKAIIEIDEFDENLRRTLNYGHTFGHALESITHHGIPHGLAVAWGMDLVNYIAFRKGLLSKADFEDIHDLLRSHFAWTLPKAIDAADLIAATRRDKKSKDGRLTLILLKEPGSLEIAAQNYTAELEEWIRYYLTNLTIVTN